MNAQAYTVFHAQLRDALKATIETSFQDHGLTYDAAAVERQGSTNLNDLVFECLAFGGDVWPAIAA